jgi:signal peptidase I
MTESESHKKNEFIRLLKGNLFQEGYPCKIQVEGRSMLPLIKAGDKVILRSCKNKAPRKFDIVAYEREGKIFLHRIIKVFENGTCICKGDNLLRSDKKVQKNELIGLVEIIERKSGKELYMRKIHWRIINALIAIYSLFKAYLWHIFRNKSYIAGAL